MVVNEIKNNDGLMEDLGYTKVRTVVNDDDLNSLVEFYKKQYGEVFTLAHEVKMKTWGRYFRNEDITPGHIEYGKRACKSLCESNPPGLLVFAKRCKPSFKEIGVPSVEQAYINATRSCWSHPLIFHAVKNIGEFNFKRWPATRTRKAFEKEYKQLIKLWIAGERFFLPKENTQPEAKPASKETIENEIKKMRSIVTG